MGDPSGRGGLREAQGIGERDWLRKSLRHRHHNDKDQFPKNRPSTRKPGGQSDAARGCGRESLAQRAACLSTPNSAPTSVKAAIARSTCSGLCAAESWTRIRAWPRGTTGNEKPIT